MKLHNYVFEVTDSDGFDSTQEIRAASLQKARAMAYSWHGTTLHGCNDDAWPYAWASLTYTDDPAEKAKVSA
jgi:hypothetical protein